MIPNFAEPAVTHCEPPDRQRPAVSDPAISQWMLRSAERACCCSARPAVIVIMPAVAGRDHATDLLLCGHHFRASRAALSAAGAAAYDEDGNQIQAG